MRRALKHLMARSTLAIATAMAIAMTGPAHALTVCTVATSAMAFGIYDTVSNSPNDTTGTVSVSCTPTGLSPLTTPYTITIEGTGSGGDTVRSVSAGGYRLYYQVHADAVRATVWGNGSTSGAGVSSSVTSAASGLVALKSHTAYGRMAARQIVGPGVYLGSLTVTVEY